MLRQLFLLLFTFCTTFVKSEPCFAPTELNLILIGANCDGTPSMTDFECGKAIDGDPNTIWHPASQDHQYFELRTKRPVAFTFMEILQYNWVHGQARAIEVDMHRGPKSRFSISLWKPDQWERAVLPFTVTTDHISIKVTQLHHAMFGGLRELKLFGCYSASNNLPIIRPDFELPPDYSETTRKPDYEGTTGHDPAVIGSIVGLIIGLLFTTIMCVLCLIAYCGRKQHPTQTLLNHASSRSIAKTSSSGLSHLDLVSLKSGMSAKSGKSTLLLCKENGDQIEVITEVHQEEEEKSVHEII